MTEQIEPTPELSSRLSGIISALVPRKGFGFIQTDDKEEWYFHYTALAKGLDFDDLTTGDAVTFKPMETGEGKKRALGVRRDG